MNDNKSAEQISAKLSALIALAMTPDVQKKKLGEKVQMLARLGISTKT